MSTCSEPIVPILPQANFAPGSAGHDSKCTEPPSAAPPTHTVMTPAIRPMAAPPHPVLYPVTKSRQLSLFCALSALKTTSFARFHDKNDRKPTAAVSCYESPCRYPVTKRPKNFSKLGQTGQNKQFDTLSIPCRYPISPEIRSHFTTQYDALGSILDRFGRILDRMRGFTYKETGATTDFGP